MTEHVQTFDAATMRAPTRAAEGTIAVQATPERVWRALTDARELERWFPLDARSEPGPNGAIWMSWRNEFAESMRIRVWDPPRHLQTTWGFHDGDGPHQTTDYFVEGKGGTTIVRAVTSGFPMDESWDGWVEGTNRGWAFELRSLKHYLERHEGESRHVVYLRRLVRGSAESVWEELNRIRELARWLRTEQAFDHRPAGQLASIVDDPADGLFRVSVEPGLPGSGQRELVLWLSAWGDHAKRVGEIEAEWQSALEPLGREYRDV